MDKVIKELKYWLQLIIVPIYWLSYLVPRDKKLWVFGSSFGKRFADNPRYFYLYTSQLKNKEVSSVWISKDKDIVSLLNTNGYNSYYYKSVKGIWSCLRAKVYIFDNYSKDISFILSGRAIKINMWHGIPLKKINKDNKFDYIRNPQNKFFKFKWALRRMSDEKPEHYVLTTSNFLKPIFSSAFQTNKVINVGYPRNDILLFSLIENVLSEKECNIIQEINIKCKNKNTPRKMLLYMPTFRESEKIFFDIIDLDGLSSYLKLNQFVLFIKLHPKSNLKDLFNSIKNENIIIIDSQIDSYSILNLSDVLITDYSSIYFDYLLTQKPIVFFNYDIREYVLNSREFYFDYNNFAPGIKAKDMIELQEAILSALKEDNDSYLEKKDNIKNLIFDEIYNPASVKLYNKIKTIINL